MVFLDPVGGGQETAAPGIGGLFQMAPRGDGVAGRQQGLAQDDAGLGGVGVCLVAQPPTPVRQQVRGQPAQRAALGAGTPMGLG